MMDRLTGLSSSQAGGLVLVALLWGSTTPLMRRASALGPDARPHKHQPRGVAAAAQSLVRYLPIGVNLSGSALFARLLRDTPASQAGLIANSLALVVTTCVARLLGEREADRRLVNIGMLLVIVGVAICMTSI
ncbi:hypothetical protein H696_01896 [Fonticula alba]|uniref:EamA domain-containing protein n=1 Tax=Fonticula alba TaxID=691883 RepID=A0A058Z9G4_FONAL|nr:hypothetical protein H696_01896 [Fonticula alba]KCV70949.1 hypothetical protein H696_01896 [Fonticula alba]|eukprot:XP_009494072.1 hypothetical protein H696_01896 [Fonticula alba]